MDSACDHPNGISAVYALTDLAATANILQVINRNTPTFNPTFRTYRYFKQAADTLDPQVIAMLLIDVIRIAYTITES